MIRLYDFPRCPFCQKVRIALAEKGLPYEKILVDLAKREQKQRGFLEMNPYGKVPVLVDDSHIIYESSIINEYLDEKYPNPPLMPPSPELRARVRILVDFAETRFNSTWYSLYRQGRHAAEGERGEELVGKAREDMDGHLRRLDSELEGRQYLAGSYSLADIAFTPRIATFDDLGITVDKKYPHLSSWIERIKSRESFAETASA